MPRGRASKAHDVFGCGLVPGWHDSCTQRGRAPYGVSDIGAEQMTYIRSRPWRPRGPWFSNRAGARRRGRRNDELEIMSAGEMTFEDQLLAESHEILSHKILGEDVLLPVVAAGPVPGRMQATAEGDHVLALASGSSPTDQDSPRPDGTTDLVIAAYVLSPQHEDDTTFRQSA
jgi:hypothetical protein